VLLACAPQRPTPNELAPARARSTNEMRAADLAVLDAWEAHRVSLMRNDGPDLAARGVALARAGAWLVYARESYVARPESSDADEALARARALMARFEPNAAGQLPAAALAADAEGPSPESWARVRRLAAAPASVADPARLAEAEIELVRASARPEAIVAPNVVLAGTERGSGASAVVLPSTISSVSISPLSCRAVQHLARATTLLREAETPAAAALVVAELHRPIERDAIAADARLHTRYVHFGLRSSLLSAASRLLLSGVASAMADHPELSIIIEAHSDPRGSAELNRHLSGSRGEAVRRVLADSGVADERMIVRLFGETRRASAGMTPEQYARDRRAQLLFLLPDGTELPLAEDGASDLQIERVARGKSPRRRAPTSGWTPNVRRSIPAPR
jgi:outer membrane protein OmpA-like peptidoglycan-associated protein